MMTRWLRDNPGDLYRHGVAGAWVGAAWCVGALLLDAELEVLLFLVAPLVALPLGLCLAAPQGGGTEATGRWRAVQRVLLPAALLLLVSFVFDPGRVAALSSLPWFLVTVLFAVLGLLRLVERGGPTPLPEFSIDCGLLFLPVGGAWLLSSRLGSGVMGFGEPIVFLAAAHFHFAGFVLPLVTGLLGRSLPGRWAGVAAIGVISGVPLVAIGITLSPRGIGSPELLAAFWLLGATLVVSGLQLRLALRVERSSQTGLLILSSLSLSAAMLLAGAYALGNYLETRWLDIPGMLMSHAALNVFGFAVPALVFWTRLSSQDRSRFPSPGQTRRPGLCVLCKRVDEIPALAAWERRDFSSGVDAGPGVSDRRDEHRLAVTTEAPGEPEPGGAYRGAAEAIRRYEIFAPHTVRPLLSRTPLEPGDTIVGRYCFLPVVEILFAARVTACHDEVVDGTWRTGFTYRTLDGHPFVGEESFLVEKDVESGRVSVALRSWSRPANLVVRILYPLLRPLQLRAGREGVARLKETALRVDASPEADRGT